MTMHHAGDVWKLERMHNWYLKNLRCRGCNKEFELGQWVVQATTTPRRLIYNLDTKYARIRHIECFVDAKGKPVRSIPK